MEELTKEQITAAMQAWQAQQIEAADLALRQHRQFTALFGPLVKGEYELGSTITFRKAKASGVMNGTVIWCYGPGQTPVTHRHHPLMYVVDCHRGVPLLVSPSE